MLSAICFNFDQSKTLLSGNGFNVAYLIISAFDEVEHIVGKGENASYQQSLHFPQSFHKPSFSG